MRNFSVKQGCLVSLCALIAQNTLAEENTFQATASVKSIWDSNFARTPEADEEQTTVTAAGLKFDDTFGRQRLLASWRGSHYQYDEHKDFDGSTNAAQVEWKGLLGSQVNTDVEWTRDSYLVDRFEFFGKDIVDRDDFNARIGYGNDHKLSFHLGGRKTNQVHSNEGRSELDFDEREAFVDAGYQTSNKSSIYIRFRSGDRSYTNQIIDVEEKNLNFDFDQVELEALWALSPKTQISAVVASFKRKGEINDASGSVATVAATWQATEKIELSGGYTFREPAIGETSDSPSKIQEVYIAALWQYSSKISVGSMWRYTLRNYDKVSPELIRDEHLYNFSPLTVTYDSGRHWLIRLDSGWRKNESPLAYRNYVARQINVGLVFDY